MNLKNWLILSLLLIVVACGYQPVYLSKTENNKKYEFSEVIFEGDKKINQRIKNTLNFIEKKTRKDLDKLIIISSYKIEETSKDTLGKISTFRSSIEINLIKKKNEKIILQKEFNQSTSYGNKDNNFELLQYQNSIKNNMINSIASEIILFLNIE